MDRSLLNIIAKSNLVIRLKSWEHWPFGIIQLPFFFYWLWLSLKARSLVFFSASNPQIETGGMFGESKFEVLAKIPGELVARSGLINVPTCKESVLQKMGDLKLTFPVIFKPDIGERGWMVKRIYSEEGVEAYLRTVTTHFIIQELIDLPLEFGVFYRRYPSKESGEVTSIVMKEMLSIEGDGHATFAELIKRKERARLHWQTLSETYRERLESVPEKGQKIELVSIGNHCLGTKFLNGNHLITPGLNESFEKISRQIPEFYFGRYDLRTASFDDLANGKVRILELNGCGAEPAHIYDPGFSLVDAMKVMYRHWKDLYRISMENHRRGVPFMSFREGLRAYKKFRAITGKK